MVQPAFPPGSAQATVRCGSFTGRGGADARGIFNEGVEVPRQVLSSGASDAGGGSVTLRATFGQPVTGVVANSGGDVMLGQGFWHGGLLDGRHRVYLPVILRAPAGR